MSCRWLVGIGKKKPDLKGSGLGRHEAGGYHGSCAAGSSPASSHSTSGPVGPEVPPVGRSVPPVGPSGRSVGRSPPVGRSVGRSVPLPPPSPRSVGRSVGPPPPPDPEAHARNPKTRRPRGPTDPAILCAAGSSPASSHSPSGLPHGGSSPVITHVPLGLRPHRRTLGAGRYRKRIYKQMARQQLQDEAS